MFSTTVAVGVRHAMEKAIAGALDDIEVQVFDAVWIAEQLSDPDLFWVAERYLQLDEATRERPNERGSRGLVPRGTRALARYRDPSGSAGDF
jgi:hypothetical protein